MAKGKKYSKNSGSAGSKVPSTSKSRGRSEELKDVEFTFGKSTNAAAFEQTKTTLVRHVGVQSWPGASVASTALEQGKEPSLKPPPKPTIPRKKYIQKVKRIVKDEHGADVEEEVDVEMERDDDEMWELREQYDLDKSDYESARKLYLDAQKAWDDNRGRMYNLVL